MEKKWMVKKAKGGVYGPVDTETIKRWIQEGRITSEDELSEEGKYNWKKVSEFDEFSITSKSSQPAQTPADTSAVSAGKSEAGEVKKYGLMFGILNLIIGGWMFIGGLIYDARIISAVKESKGELGCLGKIFMGVGIFGIIITTILWLPLFISGFLILSRKNTGRVLAVNSGKILMYAIPISFFLSFGFKKIFSLVGLVVAILFFYVIIMSQNLEKSEFDAWFVS